MCVHLASLGVHVIALSRTQADLDSLKAEIPDVQTIHADLANDAEVVSAIEAAGDVSSSGTLMFRW